MANLITLTPEREAALIEAIDLAISDQEHYLKFGHFPSDYGDEWPDVAAVKADKADGWAEICVQLGLVAMAEAARVLAQEFREHAGPGKCVTCGTQCELRGDLSVICPQCEASEVTRG